MEFRAASEALKNLTVLDLTQARAGPTAARQFADWGADVIKIEAPGGDTMGFSRHGSDFQNLHRNKRGITLNLKHPKGLEVFKRLVSKADVLLENYRPDVKFRLGIDYESLRAVNPRLVYASISGYGQDGPDRDRPGLDPITQGAGGLMWVTGLPGQGPVRAGTAISDLSAGVFCAMGVLVALLERERSGEGQWVQTSLLESLISMMDFQAARWLMDRDVPGQAGNDHPTATPAGAFETADKMMLIAAVGGRMWQRFCETIGAPELQDRPEYATPEDRTRNRTALNRAIAERLKTRTSAEWIRDLTEAGVPCGPIYKMDEVFADPQVEHLGMAAPAAHPTLGEIRIVRQAVAMNRTPSIVAKAAPELGEDQEDVLAQFGLDAAEIDDLRRDGVI